MKTLRAMVMGLALLMVCGVSKATVMSHSNPTKDEIIDTYLNAVVHGKINGLEEAIDDDAEFDMLRGSNVSVLTKSQIIGSLKSGADIEQNCNCTKTVLQNDDDKSVLKVDMKYADFTRTDVITAQPVGNGWKITKVETSYK